MMAREEVALQCAGHPEGWQAVRTFEDGRWSIRTGHGVPIRIGGYLLPDKELDPKKAANTDVYDHDGDQAWARAENDAVRRLVADMVRMREEDGLRDVVVLRPTGGCDLLADWASERITELSRMILYGGA